MTEYVVDRSGAGDFVSLAEAVKKVGAGDTVSIAPGVYREELTLDKPNHRNTIWRALDPTRRPSLEGGYDEGEVGNDFGEKPTYLPGSMFAALVTIKESGITLEGLVVQYVAGRGIVASSGSDGLTIRNCDVYHTFNSGIAINPGPGKEVDGITIRDCRVRKWSVKVHVPRNKQTEKSRQYRGGAGIKNSHCTNTTIAGNEVAHGYGEGIDIDFGAVRTDCYNNEVHDCNHVLVYNLGATDTRIFNNFIYHSPVADEIINAEGRVSAGIVYGDEAGAAAGRGFQSARVQIFNNLVVNTGALLQSRWNEHNYASTQLIDVDIAFNTFVAGPNTREGIEIGGPPEGHKRSLFTNNIVDWSDAGADSSQFTKWSGGRAGLTFENNLWSQKPIPAMSGPGDIVADPNLVDPHVSIVAVGFDPDNYRLRKSSVAINKATDKPQYVEEDALGAVRVTGEKDLGAFESGYIVPEPPEPEPEPEPEPPAPPPDPEPEPEPEEQVWLEAGWYKARFVASED